MKDEELGLSGGDDGGRVIGRRKAALTAEGRSKVVGADAKNLVAEMCCERNGAREYSRVRE